MSVTPEQIVRYLPYLRRYARALTGSQAVGDQYVEASVETLLAEQRRLEQTDDARKEIFCIFHDVWRVVHAGLQQLDEEEAASPQDAVASGLLALPPLHRQVLLLISLEGFSYEQVSEILQIDIAEVREHLVTAREELRRQTAVPIMVIEDEALIAMNLASIIEEMGHVHCGSAASEAEAIRLARSARPALILADIRLRDGDNGLVAVREILKTIDVPVIVITAFPEQLLTGVGPEPAFVITKPFQPETLRAAIGQALVAAPSTGRPAAAAPRELRPSLG